MLRRFLLRGCCAFFAILIPLLAHGANKTWTVAVSGDFGAAANWTGGVPGAADTATFNAAGTYTVTFDNSPNLLANPVLNQDLFYSAGDVTFTSGTNGQYTYQLTGSGGDDALITGGTLTLGTAGNPLHMIVDDDLLVRGGATLNVTSGSAVITRDLLIAQTSAGGNGTLVIDGTGSSISASGTSTWANLGNTATVTFQNNASGSFGAVTVAQSATFPSVSVGNVVVQSGADVTFGTLNLAPGFATGATFTVDGPGSTVTLTGGSFSLGNGTLTISNGALFDAGAFGIGLGATTVVNLNGATLRLGGFNAGAGSTFNWNSGTVSFTGNLAVDGGGLLGNALGNNPTLTAGYRADVSGTTTILPSHTLTLDGGTLNIGDLVVAGTFVLNSGSTFGMASGSSVRVESGAFIQSSVPITAGDVVVAGTLTLNTGGTLGIDPAGSVRVESGALIQASAPISAGDIVVAGTLTLNSGGTLAIDSAGSLRVEGGGIVNAGASINGSIINDVVTSTLNVAATGISLGNAASLNGFYHEGPLNVGSHSVTLNSASHARLGLLTTISGGTINAPNGVAFATGTNLLGHGAVHARVSAELGSVIEADGELALGDATSPAGYVANGELRVKQHTVTLSGSAQAMLGSLTTLGSGANPGTLSAANGVVVDFGRSLTGFGMVNSTNTLAKRTIINGVAQGNSVAQPLTFSGYVKGVGTFDNVNFSGTFDPGLSSTLSTVGSITLEPTSTLIIEIGGIARGSQYDAVLASGNLGLGGTLAVMLTGGSPAAGDLFDILDWASLSGTFDALQLPSLGANLMWNTSQLYTDGVLRIGLTGDYNLNGVVDAADYAVWRNTLGQTGVGLAADGDGDGAIDSDDYNVWRAHFGQTAGSGSASNAAVPEPASALLLIIGAAIGSWSARRAASAVPSTR